MYIVHVLYEAYYIENALILICDCKKRSKQHSTLYFLPRKYMAPPSFDFQKVGLIFVNQLRKALG